MEPACTELGQSIASELAAESLQLLCCQDQGQDPCRSPGSPTPLEDSSSGVPRFCPHQTYFSTAPGWSLQHSQRAETSWHGDNITLRIFPGFNPTLHLPTAIMVQATIASRHLAMLKPSNRTPYFLPSPFSLFSTQQPQGPLKMAIRAYY